MNVYFRKSGAKNEPVPDERSYERTRIVLNLICRQRETDFPIFTDDVSETGIKFVSQQPLVADENALLLTPALPGHPPIVLRGRVVWARQEGEHQHVGGMAFLYNDDKTLESWKAFIASNL